MAQGGKGKKVVSLLEKKDAANATISSLRREIEEANSMMDKMESLEGQELREFVSQNKRTMGSTMKAAMNKPFQKSNKPKKKRIVLHPIIGAALKHHKDDHDVVRATAGSTGTA